MQDIQTPLVSIIIPTFNRAELIKDTFRSIKAQTYSNWECIVVDDGSTDNTREVVKKFIERDKRFCFIINNRKKGAQGSRNTGLLQANGEFISFFDSDDLMHPERLARQIIYLEENPQSDICTCYSHLLNDNHQIIGAFCWITKGDILNQILAGTTYVDFNSAIIRRDVMDKIGLLDEDCPAFQEWDTHIRLAGFANYGSVHEFLISYYQRSIGRISNDSKRELHGYSYIYAKHKKLLIDVAGESVYLSKIYSLATRILREDKLFQKEMILILPDLKKTIILSKIKIFLQKLLDLLR